MKLYAAILSLLFYFNCGAQELFPLTEPASTVPKGAIGARAMSQVYQEYSQTREMFATRLMYGVTSKLTVEFTAAGSNHHDTLLPPNLVTHTHSPQGANIYSAQGSWYGIPYPFLFAGFNFDAKYRIFSHDGDKSHFRIALFADYSTVNAAHDEAEPELIDDCGGYEGGFIATKLMDRWAFSLTSDYIHPFSFTEVQTKDVRPAQVTVLQYGDALEYNLSIGYRFYPSVYTNDYSQNNFNLYVEFLCKSYNGANVTLNGQQLTIKTNLLMPGHYVEMHPGIQWIINSNTRVEFAVGYPIVGESYARFYPVYDIAIQRYFFFTKTKPEYKLPVPMN